MVIMIENYKLKEEERKDRKLREKCKVTKDTGTKEKVEEVEKHRNSERKERILRKGREKRIW